MSNNAEQSRTTPNAVEEPADYKSRLYKEPGAPRAESGWLRRSAQLARLEANTQQLGIFMLIGLTGGIGSGKSTVASVLKERGFTIVDADQIAREIVEPGRPALVELVETFGSEILDGEKLNRQKLAELAFATPEATEKLNSITHPRIRQETDRRIKAAPGNVVYDMPLLVDLGLHEGMDLTVVVATDIDTRVERLVQRGLTEEDARRRIAAQISDVQRNAAADVLIDNNGTLQQLHRQVEDLVSRLNLEKLVGVWQGSGRGFYPTIDSFEYQETVEFSQIPGKPFLVYVQKTKGPNGPMHTESGYLRPGEPVEFTIAQPTGQTELLEGAVTMDDGELVITMDNSNVHNSTRAKQVDATKRVYRLSKDGNTLTTEFHMAAVDQEMQQHLESELKRGVSS